VLFLETDHDCAVFNLVAAFLSIRFHRLAPMALMAATTLGTGYVQSCYSLAGRMIALFQAHRSSPGASQSLFCCVLSPAPILTRSDLLRSTYETAITSIIVTRL
jgi:hypothetical protein